MIYKLYAKTPDETDWRYIGVRYTTGTIEKHIPLVITYFRGYVFRTWITETPEPALWVIYEPDWILDKEYMEYSRRDSCLATVKT